MTQPPLSRAIEQPETELGAVLLHRSSTGVAPPTAGMLLYDEARTLLEQAEHLQTRVAAAAGLASLTIGVLASSAQRAGDRLAAAFRERHPHVDVKIREADSADPTAGLRAGLVDVALTRGPFLAPGVRTRFLRSDPIAVVLRADDPLARRDGVRIHDLRGRRWFQLPDGTDTTWRAYWKCTAPDDKPRRPHRPRVPAGRALERQHRVESADRHAARRACCGAPGGLAAEPAGRRMDRSQSPDPLFTRVAAAELGGAPRTTGG